MVIFNTKTITFLRKIALFTLLLAESIGYVHAANFDVPTNGTLTQAITAANAAGLTVPYQISISANITSAALPGINVATSIFSNLSGTQRTVNLNGSNRLIYNGSALSSSITDLIITGATAGAINNLQTLTLTNATFNANAVAGNGGAITNNNGTLISNAGNTFTSNTTGTIANRFGGAIYNTGASAVATIDTNTFTSNNAYNGGGIWTGNGANAIIDNSTFNTNNARNDGGGLYVLDGAQATVTNSTFTGNTATRFGGAITSQGTLILGPGNSFIDNTASQYAGAVGLGVIQAGSFCSVDTNLFQGNKSLGANGGGAIANGDLGILTITNSQFLSNSARFGGALWNGEGSQMTVDTSTFTGNFLNGTGTSSGGGAINNVSAGIVTLNAGNIFTSNLATGTNGGAIYNTDTGSIITITGDTFTTNSATSGGAIYNANNGQIILNDGNVFTSNSATANGGAINNASGGKLTLNSGNTFTTNTATTSGGAIYSNSNTANVATVVINGANFNQNSAGTGGAVYITAASALANISNSTFNGNIANIEGGAIWSTTKLTLDGNLFQSNRANGTSATTGDGGAIRNATSVVINNNTFDSNHANYRGGAIYNTSTTIPETITGSLFTSNTAALGGAIYGGAGTISNSEFDSNSANFTSGATGDGGAIYNTGVVAIENTSFNSNSANGTTNTTTGRGGAIYNTNSGLSVNNASFSSNTATAQGGAIYNTGGTAAAMIAITNTSFSQNSAPAGGGAITNTGQMNLTTDAFIGNKALGTTATPGNGGAVYNNAATAVVNIDGSGFSGNEANNGGAIYNFNGLGATINLTNTALDNNTATSINATTGNGGGINNNGTLNIKSGNALTNNSADLNGGAIYNTRTTNIVGNNLLEGNSATINGGAIFNASALNLTSNATGDIVFVDNTAGGQANDIFNSAATSAIAVNGTTGTVYLGSGVKGLGTITKTNGGTLVLGEDSINQNFTGTYNQTGGTLTNYSTSFLGGNNTISNSNLNLFQTANLTINRLSLNNANVDSRNNLITTTMVNTFTGTGTNNFSIDIDGNTNTADKFIFNGNTTGIFDITNINVMGTPTAEVIPLQIFQVNSTQPGYIQTVAEPVMTPIYEYGFRSDGLGQYSLFRTSINPAVFRAQVATMSAFNNQLTVNNTLFDHVYLDSNELIGGTNKNKYAAISPLFAPYQYSREGGSLWFKTYTTFERLSMNQGLNVGNNAYGSLVGADFEVVNLKNGWQVLPTAYIGYNGGHQTFDGVSMYQNGGQGGAMATFMKGDFISSLLAYAGGYANEMQISSTTDNTNNWFAGTAVKAAYNFHPKRNIILQPTLLASYNAFGKQNFFSNFGQIGMGAGMLNGINVAPGLHFIYGKETWSIYATAQYMYYINDQISGNAGSSDLPNVQMNHGFIEYGIGATKTWKDRLMGYFQVALRNGGRTGVGFQLGLAWKF